MSTLVSSEVGVGSWLVARWRVVVLVSAVVILGLVATIAVVVPALNSSDEAGAEGFDCSQLEESSFDAAAPKAMACEVDVEVTGERTPWSTTWATSEGPIRLEQSVSPSRTSVTGEWTDIDTTLEVDAETGVVSPIAPVFEIELNGGTGRPLGAITREGKRIEVGSPVRLPVPDIVDGRATYRIADGVRLIVTVNEDGTGFFPVFELATPEAAGTLSSLLSAQRAAAGGLPAGGNNALQLVFPVSMPSGLHLEADGNAANVVDELGETHFVVPPPVMWDSAAAERRGPELLEVRAATGAIGAVDDRLAAPLPGDRVSQMALHVESASVAVDPDEAMLTAPETVWPVYLDPGFNGKPAADWIAVRTGGYTGSLYNWGDISSTMRGEGAGYCSSTASCNTQFTQRLIWEFDGLDAVRGMVGSDVISASFTVNGEHSYSCAATTTDMHVLLEGVSAGQTWGSHNWHQWTLYSSRTEAHSASCGNQGYRSFDATSAVKHLAEYDWSTLPLGLKARDESTMTGWKRFRHDATLSVSYNRPPNAPSSLKITNPDSPSCVTGGGRPFINSTTPTLSAIVSDPDGQIVNSRFKLVSTAAPSTLLWDEAAAEWEAASGTRFHSTLRSGVLSHGGTYAWRVQAGDWALLSPFSAWCEFTVDTEKPNPPTVTAVTSGPNIQAVYEPNRERGGKGLKGKFRIGPNGSSDVVAFRVSFGDPNALTSTTVAAGASFDVEHIPARSGPMTLYVESVDRAGNVSPTRTTYQFEVASPVEDVIWKLDEGSGSSSADRGPKGADPLTIAGAGWVAGPHQLFGSRTDDMALKFDGVNDAALGGGPVVDTSKSFTVSAHVRLADSKLGLGNYTVLSQDGVTQSGFRLGYRANCGGGTGCWSFGMPDTSSGASITAASSSGEVTAGEWVHLVGVHDATAKTVRLWVCEVGTPDASATGEPVATAPVTRAGTAWQASGVFAVGRGQNADAGGDWWPGEIDNVRVFSGQVADDSKLRRLCQGAEVENFGQGAAAFDAVDPTVREQ
ncbi:LamG domain-containing protein [Agromyces sp. NPDC058136]|uniref:LamG domain-containing protein n=1 Tax=Agromyces sp. NPDC058136 TaxID=3346354 RepID=UPI0036D958B1